MKDLKNWICHDPYWIIRQIEKLPKEGVPEKDVAEQLGFGGTTEMRRWKSGYLGGSRVVERRWVYYLLKEGKSVNEIAQIIDKNESTVRLLVGYVEKSKLAEEA